MPKTLSVTFGNVRGGRYPRALMVSVLAWLLLGIVMLFSTLGAPDPSNQDRATQNALDATYTTQVRAPTGEATWWFPLLPIVGVLILAVTVVLFIGHGWARFGLALLGVVSVVALAEAASWLVFPAVALVVIACVCGLLLSTHRYLQGGPTTPVTEGVPSDG